MTLVGYFNATRELAGMRRYLDDDVTTRVRRQRPPQGLSEPVAPASGCWTIAELTSRIASADISATLKKLEIEFDPSSTLGTPEGIADDWKAALDSEDSARAAGRRRAGRAVADERLETSPSTSCWPPRCSRSVSTSPASG